MGFADCFSIVNKVHTGELLLSPSGMNHLEENVAPHLSARYRLLYLGDIDEIGFENSDLTHFVIYMDNRKTLSCGGESEIKYADVFLQKSNENGHSFKWWECFCF